MNVSYHETNIYMKKKQLNKQYIKKISKKIAKLEASLEDFKLNKLVADDVLQEQLELWDEHLKPYEKAYNKAKRKVKNRKKSIVVLKKLLKQSKKKSKKPSKSKESFKHNPIPAPAKLVSPAVKENDLKRIEGIGPQIEKLLKSAGIRTFSVLAATSVSRLKEILNTAGSRFKMHQPDTWPTQGALAANGKWQELKDLQNKLNGGK